MQERNQIADELWAAFKNRWTGERKYALRQITKHLTGKDDMSSWHYQIMQHFDDNNEPYLKIHEAYIGHDKSESWTEKAVTATHDTFLLDNAKNMVQYPQNSKQGIALTYDPIARLVQAWPETFFRSLGEEIDAAFAQAHKLTAEPIEAETLSEMRMTLLNILRDLERHGVKDAKTGAPIS